MSETEEWPTVDLAVEKVPRAEMPELLRRLRDRYGAEWLDAAYQDLQRADGAAPETPLLFDLHGPALARFKARAEGKEVPVPVPWSSVAMALGDGPRGVDGGFLPGLHYLVGGTGTGKTQWALQVALEAAQKGTPVLYFGLEMGPEDLTARFLGLMTGEKWSRIYRGKLNPHDYGDAGKLATPVAALRNMPLYVETARPRGLAAEELPRIVERIREKHAAGEGHKGNLLVVVDFVQLLAGDARELRERIGNAAYALTELKTKHRAAVLVVSSTARTNYGELSGNPYQENMTAKKRYELPWNRPADSFVGTGKESGDLEFSADTVLVLCREAWASRDTPPADGTRIHLAVAKARAGYQRWVRLLFDGSRFDEPKAGPKWAEDPERHCDYEGKSGSLGSGSAGADRAAGKENDGYRSKF